jgi:ABC-2 type transport system ATP-binding protein
MSAVIFKIKLGRIKKAFYIYVYYLTNTLMILIENLTFRYRRKKFLYKNLNLSLEAGCIYGLLGKNGAGKSTLMKSITGLLFPNEGSIKVNGFRPRRREPAFLQSIYLIPEEVYVPTVTISRYINLFACFYPKFNKEDLFKYLEELDVPREGKLTTFSAGQQKKFIIAFALACNTEVLLLDEPTNGLDIPSKTRFRKLIASTMRDDRMIFISTHQIRDLENLIDNIIIVDNGNLILSASLQEISATLSFRTVDTIPDEEILFSEQSLRGTSIITRNTDGRDTKINLEQLFNAITEQPEISKLFTTQH